MIDPALFDMMHGITTAAKKKVLPMVNTNTNDPFGSVIEKSIQEEVDLMLANEDPNQKKFLSVQARRTKLEDELRESLDLSEFGKHVTIATNIIKNEGDQYLEKQEFDLLIEGLNNLQKQMSKLDPNNLNDDAIKEALTLTPTNLASIQKIGIAKFSDGHMPESLSIFALLSALDSQEPDYWYRLGLVAQKCEQYDLALRAFALTSLFAPEFIGAHIFAAECYLNLEKYEDALAEVNEIKKILETTKVNDEWQARLIDIEKLLSAAKPIGNN
ncbi:MAG: hypothetical protein H0U49_02465 [Parachlamydiaceae bacterium]|nr:hypothetical protein [Parachlamydiaceae bacterium]